MSLLRWIVIAVVFVVLLFVSMENSKPVTLKVFDLYSWEAPLVFVILIAFATGVALGLLAGAIKIVRLKRQVNRLRRDQRNAVVAPTTRAPAPGTGPASGPGFEPPTTGF